MLSPRGAQWRTLGQIDIAKNSGKYCILLKDRLRGDLVYSEKRRSLKITKIKAFSLMNWYIQIWFHKTMTTFAYEWFLDLKICTSYCHCTGCPINYIILRSLRCRPYFFEFLAHIPALVSQLEYIWYNNNVTITFENLPPELEFFSWLRKLLKTLNFLIVRRSKRSLNLISWGLRKLFEKSPMESIGYFLFDYTGKFA